MNASKKHIIRLLRYKDSLKQLKSLGFIKVFSDNIADSVGVTPSQVRKDFSIFGIPGNKRGGYLIENLLDDFNKILGKSEIHNVIVVGIGNLGSALIKYKHFEKENIRIIAGFDNNTYKIEENSQIPILHIDKMKDFIISNNVDIGIITVPENAAQSVLDIMIKAGIKGILNFTPVQLKVKDDVIIHNIHLQTELECLIYFVNISNRNNK
jgi:redox-sensing transcriptional repressor